MIELPEDLAEWPVDPFSLFGLTATDAIDERALRRAYKQRIVVFKPEHFPNHFRRLREAYEEIQRHIEFQKFAAQWRDDEDAASPPDVSIEQAPGAAQALSPEPPLREASLASQSAPEASAWKLACQGKHAEAYALLAERQAQNPDSQPLYLRLYWLLSLRPGLDSTRTPEDWLLAGLARTRGEPSALRELFRRHAQVHPGIALDEAVSRLIISAELHHAIDLVEIRWQAAAKVGQWRLIRDDLNYWSKRILELPPTAWLQILTIAMNQSVWSLDPQAIELMQVCLDEIDNFSHLTSELFDQMARIDFLRSLWTDYQRSSPKLGATLLLGLIAASWNDSPHALRPRLLMLLNVTMRHPDEFLKRLDELGQAGPSLLAQFGNMLSSIFEYFPPNHEDTRDEEADAEIIAFAQRRSWTPFLLRQRIEILQFCIREGVWPEHFAAGATYLNLAAGDTLLGDRIRNDWPLQFTYLAYRVLHA